MIRWSKGGVPLHDGDRVMGYKSLGAVPVFAPTRGKRLKATQHALDHFNHISCFPDSIFMSRFWNYKNQRS